MSNLNGNNKSKKSINQIKNNQINKNTGDNYKINKYDERNKHNYKNGQKGSSDQKVNLYILPLIFIVAILPLIMKLKDYNPNLAQFIWYSNSIEQQDFFLYYKQWIFVVVIAIMVIIMAYRIFVTKKYPRFLPILIPLSVYAILALLSAIFSKYASFSFLGSMEQFESVFVILGYCLIVFYVILFINTENDVRNIVKYLLFSVLIFGMLGLSQFIGHDFFATELGTKLITSAEYVKNNGGLTFVFGKNRVYLTLYNPNYVGVYVALIAPVFLILLMFSKKLINSLLYLFTLIGLIICVIGAQSISGLIGLAIAGIGILFFMWKYLIKRLYITIPVLISLVIAVFVINALNDNFMIKRIQGILQVPTKTEKNLTNIVTGDDRVTLTYKGNQMNIAMLLEDTTSLHFDITDEDNNVINNTYDNASGLITIQDERYPGFSIMPVQYGDYLSFDVKIDGYDWYFTNQTEDGTYYLHTRFGKLDKVVSAPSAIFTGYEMIATGRGYIWGRTIPLVKHYVFLGSGPDTFTMAFPQQDYLGFYNYEVGSNLITKPHNLYLQIAVQTGLFSLIAFLLFYIIYFISSIRIYIKGRFHSYYAQVGVAIFIGTIAYMVAGLTNDSSITTAPVFWTLISIGIVVNYKVRPLIMEESAALIVAREEKRALKKESKKDIVEE